MKKFSDEEKKQLNEKGHKYLDKWRESRNKALSKLPPQLKELADDCRYTYSGNFSSALYKELSGGLANGKYEKPSDFLREHCEPLFKGWIFPSCREYVFYSADSLSKWQSQQSSQYRRSFRTNEPECIADNVMKLLYNFSERYHFDAKLIDIINDNLSDEMLAHKYATYYYGLDKYAVACEIDSGNEQVISAVRDIINGESETEVSVNIIRGIIKSHNNEMHELLGRLLLAARLQEGLRQAICENADCGTIEGFKVILKVIEENNLIRFSSVKRAVGTWTGLLAADCSDLERISSKTLRLISECIDDEKAREKYLSSEDSMEIYIALWAYGCYEIKTAAEKVKMLSESGTHHQLLTAGYFAEMAEDTVNSSAIAKAVIFSRSEPDILAVYLPHFMKGWTFGYRISYSGGERKIEIDSRACLLSRWYESREEAEKMYERLWEIYDIIPKKALTFSPCIFPWYSTELSRADIALRLCLTAFMLDDDKLDKCCKLIKEVDSFDRSLLISVIISDPRTPVQRAALTEALSDKSSYVREQAAKIIKKVSLEEENYLQMEDMLRLKAEDMRSTLISILYNRNDRAVLGTVTRLLSDKKEERRTAGLDIVMQLSKDCKKTALYEKCLPLAKEMPNPTSKEKILIDSLCGEKDEKSLQSEPLYDHADKYEPAIPDNAFTRECVRVFMDYFPDSQVGNILYPDIYKKSVAKAIKDSVSGICGSRKRADENIKKLEKLLLEYRREEFVSYGGETATIDSGINNFQIKNADGIAEPPFMDVWRGWMTVNKLSARDILSMCIALGAAVPDCSNEYISVSEKYIAALYGNGFEKYAEADYQGYMGCILEWLLKETAFENDIKQLSAAEELWYLKAVKDNDVLIRYKYGSGRYDGSAHLIMHNQIRRIMRGCFARNDENGGDRLAIDHLAYRKSTAAYNTDKYYRYYQHLSPPYGIGWVAAVTYGLKNMGDYIYAAYRGYISEKNLYSLIFDKKNMHSAFALLSSAAIAQRETDKQISTRGETHSGWAVNRRKSEIADLMGADNRRGEFTIDNDLLRFADSVYEKVITEVLAAELTRGDTPTEYSENIKGINRIYGIDNFIAILSALGKDTLERSYYGDAKTKKGALSHLLSVCVPAPEDNLQQFKNKLKDTDITEKRLIEAAMYSPEWMQLVGEYLGWEGFTSACYYFIAHMNESFDDKRKAVIAKYTPLSEDELNSGAFDIGWFRSAYETLGQKRFDMIYDAAKYISDGAKHSRARKYADAVLGKMEPDETREKIADKRNKDLLMAYALIPISNEDDICGRYLYLQQFLKESKKFGSQRSASEKKAVETAMQNLSINAGYSDVTRLTLKMETKLIDDSRELFNEREVDDVVVKLSVDESGKSEIICTKGGKVLKSVPAKLKKNEYIVRLNDTKKKLTEQYRRTRVMFEQAMECSTEFTVSELNILRNNPVVLPVIKNIVFKCGDKLGFLDGNMLTDYKGDSVQLSDDDKVITAHPFAIYSDGHWSDYQKYLFDNSLVQAFKQVFRELYIKTAEELEMTHSLRYSGNQIQPAKTAACLKTRRWVADIEDGLQKVYYKENIVARIYAMADWFSPSDIEPPAIEWVEFTDRKTGMPLAVKEIPDIIFSEVMRDVDMAVSVAHAGGVDPETSHSTIEMRAAIIGCTLPLFKLKNVTLKGSHAHIIGKYGEYTLHLGSGIVHKKGGAMVNILPVHSQHRGKLFLPFADEDPKTAEIITKLLFLAQDDKIKDPSILEQIK